MTNHSPLRVQLMTIITVVMFLLATLAPVNAAPRPASSSKAPAAKPDQPVSKTQSVSSFVQGVTSAGSFYGIVSVNQFAVLSGVLTAAGTFSGFVTPSGGSTSSVTQNFTGVPVTAIDPSCSILTLTLGPLNLNLLGLVVTLNQVNLTISAISGAGNLLGNLLCDVANLLNPGGPLSGLSSLLTNLVTALNSLLSAL
jgi:hypothetical protein